MEDRPRFCALLADAIRGFARLSDAQAGLCWEHYQAMVRWNRSISLTTVVEMGEAVVRHYAESLFLGVHLPFGELRVADVGSGPGFPGFPCAVLRPDCRFLLVESVGKKASFLREAASLPNTQVVAARAESLEVELDWLISRAVRPRDVVRVAKRRGAAMALLIGRKDAEELVGFEIIDLPWGESRVLAVRHVSRGTNTP